MLPVEDVQRPACLTGQTNGRLPDSLLHSTPGLAGGPAVRLVEPATRGWRAMSAEAQKAGHTLKATSLYDSYRPYEVQYTTFINRYEPSDFPGYIGTRYWPKHYDLQGNVVLGRTWYQKPHTAVAAVPGTSNHGLGLAVDTGEEIDGDAGTESLDDATLAWLVANEMRFGFSHEVQSERWHIRYWAGDAIPAAVLAYEGAGDDDMGAFVLSGFTGQPDGAQGAYHVADASPQGFHLAPREPGWNAACWPNAPVLKPGAPVPTKYDYAGVLRALFGPPRDTGGGSAPAGPVDLTEASVARVAKATADEIAFDPERDGIGT